MSTPPAAHGPRAEWQDVPAGVRSAIEDRLGSPVVSAVNQQGGFSPGIASRIVTASGARAFVKASGPELNPDTPGIFRREAEVVAQLPAGVPVPRFLWSYDDEETGWVALAFEDIDGHMPSMPWTEPELERVLGGLHDLLEALTPSPIQVGSASDMFRNSINGWRLLDQSGAEQLDHWSYRHLDKLVQLERLTPEAVVGDTLLHLDIRADNVLLTDEEVYFVDWPLAHRGAAWVDLIAFAPSVYMQGGPEPEEILKRFEPAHRADRDRVTSVVAAVAGFFIHRSLQPPPPGLPTVRAFQTAQGQIALEWLRQRTGWN